MDHINYIYTFILWLTCQNMLPTKDILHRFGIVTYGKCIFCSLNERCNHLFFECKVTKNIWIHILNWMNLSRIPMSWYNEMNWVCHMTRCKSCKKSLLKISITEIVYIIWTARNKTIFQNMSPDYVCNKDIINVIHVRAKTDRKLVMCCSRI